jgi:hypothetical protein
VKFDFIVGLFSMSVNTFEEIEFLSALQSFTIHCVANKSPSKIQYYCDRLLSAVKNLPKLYIGHKVQIALSLESASQRNESILILNKYMNIISHLIYLSPPNLILQEEEKCKEWTQIDLTTLLNQCEHRFKKQSYSSTLWIEVLNETSLVRTNINYFQNNSFHFVQHDTDIHQLFQWINQNRIEITGRFNRTYGGVPLFWCTPLSSQAESKYGSIRLIFPFSLVYSSIQHHLFDLGTRKNNSDIWHNILITSRKQIAGYGTDFAEVSSVPSSPVDIAIDLTDGPLILSDVRIEFVNHTHRCIPILPQRLTPQHACYNTSHSAMFNFIRHLRKDGQFTLNQLQHFFDLQIFEKLEQINNTLSVGEMGT